MAGDDFVVDAAVGGLQVHSGTVFSRRSGQVIFRPSIMASG